MSEVEGREVVKGRALTLKKSIYGLVQVARQGHMKFEIVIVNWF
jgi:hypothetical protein